MPLLQLPAPLVLASTSRYRQAQLARFGLPFACVRPDYDEQPVEGLSARALVRHHAEQKALTVHGLPQHASHLVLGADQGAVLRDAVTGRDKLLGKPGTVDAAVAQLLALAGRTHELWTAVCLVLPDGQRLVREVGVELEVRALTKEEALAYVELDQPLDCAGSYKIEAAGPWLFKRIQGDDPTAIEGLPMMAVGELLRRATDLMLAGALDRARRHS